MVARLTAGLRLQTASVVVFARDMGLRLFANRTARERRTRDELSCTQALSSASSVSFLATASSLSSADFAALDFSQLDYDLAHASSGAILTGLGIEYLADRKRCYQRLFTLTLEGQATQAEGRVM